MSLLFPVAIIDDVKQKRKIEIKEGLLCLSCDTKLAPIQTCKQSSSSSSSSCRPTSTDIPEPLSPHLPIVRRLWQVFRVTSRMIT